MFDFHEAALGALKMLSCACDGSLGLDFHPNQGCLLMNYLAEGKMDERAWRRPAELQKHR